MATFDPQLLQEYADELYKKAKSLVVMGGITGAIIGVILGVGTAVVLYNATAPHSPGNDLVGWAAFFAIVFLAIGLVIGVNHATSKAFLLKLQAQNLLLQMEIERNTRPESVQQQQRTPLTIAQSAR